jgi:hypothetical protein
MVDDRGQLYTIEGISAALIMLVSAYLVVNATSVYTPGDTHISDMQLEQLGTDALRMMNTPVNATANSTLQDILYYNNALTTSSQPFDNKTFDTVFLNYVNNITGSQIDNYPNGLHYNATVTYYNSTSRATEILPLSDPTHHTLTGGEHPVRVTEWVIVNKPFPDAMGTTNKPRAVLVEVLLWRD